MLQLRLLAFLRTLALGKSPWGRLLLRGSPLRLLHLIRLAPTLTSLPGLRPGLQLLCPKASRLLLLGVGDKKDYKAHSVAALTGAAARS